MSFQKPLKLFIAYAHEDESFKNELTIRLEPLKQEGKIKVWHDGELKPGDKWWKVRDSYLDDADVVLYLASPYSLASSECNKETASALDNKKLFIPIILRECDWKNYKVGRSSIADFQVLPKDGKPINSQKRRNKDKAWQNVINEFRKILDTAEEQKDTHQSTPFELDNVKYMFDALDEARMAYTKAIGLNPKHVQAYYNRGLLFDNLKQYDKALVDYTKVIDLDPNHAGTYNNRGSLLHELGQYNKALADYNKAIDLDPKQVQTYYNRGLLFSNIKQYDKALADYTKAIDIDPNHARIYNNRGNLLHGLGQYEKAKADFDKAIDIDPKHVQAYYNRGLLFDNLKQYDKALADYTKAIDIDPNHARIYNNRGNLLHGLGQHDKAKADFDKAIDIDPNFAGTYYNRGNLLSELKRYNEAVVDVKKAKVLSQKEGNQGGVAVCELWLNKNKPSSDSPIKFSKSKGSLLTGRNKSKEERILEVMYDLNHSLKGCETQLSANSERIDELQRLSGVLARTCSMFLRKMVIGDRDNKKTRLLNDEILQSLELKFSKIIKIPEKRKPLDALNMSSSGSSVNFKKFNETTGLPESSHDLPISPMECRISIDWPLPGVANWTENPTKENMWCIQEKELFDTQNNDVFDCDEWLGQQLVMFDDKGITLKDVIKTVANYEGAHASNVFRLSQLDSDERNYSPAIRPELHILNNIKFFGIKYSHIIVIESALYLYEKLIKNDLCKSIRGDAYKTIIRFASPSPENTFLEYSKWLRYDGWAIPTFGNEKIIILHRIKAVS